MQHGKSRQFTNITISKYIYEKLLSLIAVIVLVSNTVYIIYMQEVYVEFPVFQIFSKGGRTPLSR